jgi:1,4-dihydroxy-2-naphthoate phytyltransferase
VLVHCLSGLSLSLLILLQPNQFASKALYAAICCGYLYQGPPFRWSYLGLGEPLCFLAFGPLATNAFYLAQIPAAQTIPDVGASLWSVIPGSMWAISTFIGISTTVILFCSHFHQIDGDRAAGKQSPLVRMGVEKATSALKVAIGSVYTVMLVLSLFGVLPFAMWTSGMISYGFAAEMVKFAEAEGDNPDTLKSLKFLATRWHIAFSSMLILGLIVAKLMVI